MIKQQSLIHPYRALFAILQPKDVISIYNDQNLAQNCVF